MSLSSGTRLGPYEILSPLGAGGMGEVYRARDGKLNRDVALKVLPDSFANDPERLARFQREAQVLASLNHPNIAHIHGIEDAPGVRALVMELVEGPTLADRIAQGAIPFDEALPIAKQIVDALEAAHAQGIIHRDLKPANVKVRTDGTVKVLDFGLAKALVPEGAGTTANAMNSPTITFPAMMTNAGVILGTAAYMSPEQAKGKVVDKRTDIWAFGCVFFEMLTGARAFEGEDVSETMAAILRAEPDWKLLPADVPEQIRFLIKRCLEKDRAKRLADFSVVQFVMNDVLPAAPLRPAVEHAARPMWRRAMAFALTAFVSGAVVASIAYYNRPTPVPPTVTRFPIVLVDGQFTSLGRQAVAISPDGMQMVYVANRALWLRSMSEPTARSISGIESTSGPINPVFSPDGHSLAFWSPTDQTLKKIAVTGGAAITLCPATAPYGMSWTADGIVFGQGAGGIMRVSDRGGKPEQLASVRNDQLAHGPQILPGGELLLYTIATGMGLNLNRWNTAQVVLQSLTSGERTTLIEAGSDARYVASGHIVYALGGVLYAVAFDLKQGQVTGGAVPVLEGVASRGQTGSAQFSVATNGSLMYIPGPVSGGNQQWTLALFEPPGAPESLKVPPGAYSSPRISRDGKYVAFGNHEGKLASVWVGELSGASSIRQLTFGGNNQYPVWSPDGQRIAFTSDREGDSSIFWQKADGTDTAERLTRAEKGTSHVPKSWSSDGKHLLFEAAHGVSISLWTLSLQDRESTRIAGVQSSVPLDPVFSPDGRWVAYQTNETGANQVYVQPFPAGAKYLITKSGGSRPVWSPDGTQLFYFPPGAAELAVVTIATLPSFTFGNPRLLQRGWLETYAQGPRVYDIMPDGKRFIAVVPAGEVSWGAPIALQINVVLNWFEELKAKVPTGN